MPTFGGYSPAQVSGVAYWYEADQITGVADGNPVSAWPDLSPSAGTLISAGGAAPTFRATGGPAGRPAVQFNGTTSYMFAPSGADASFLASGLTIFALYFPTSLTNGTVVGGMGSGNGFLQYKIAASGSISGALANLGQFLATSQNGSIVISKWNLSGLDFANPGVSRPFVAGVQTSATTQRAPLQGTNQQVGSYQLSAVSPAIQARIGRHPAAPVITPLATPLMIGARQLPFAEGFTGSIAALIAYRRVLSTVERAIVHSYLQDKYGVQVADYLGPWKPFSSLPQTMGPAAVGPTFFTTLQTPGAAPSLVVALQGSSLTGALSSGSLTVAVPLTAISLTGSQSTADMSVSVPLVASSQSGSASTVSSSASVPLAGQSAAGSQTTATVSVAISLVGTSNAGTSATAALSLGLPLAAMSATGSVSTASLNETNALTGSSVSGSTSTATVALSVMFAGTSRSGSSTTGALRLIVALGGTSPTGTRSLGGFTIGISLAGQGLTGSRTSASVRVVPTPAATPSAGWIADPQTGRLRARTPSAGQVAVPQTGRLRS